MVTDPGRVPGRFVELGAPEGRVEEGDTLDYHWGGQVTPSNPSRHPSPLFFSDCPHPIQCLTPSPTSRRTLYERLHLTPRVYTRWVKESKGGVEGWWTGVGRVLEVE